MTSGASTLALASAGRESVTIGGDPSGPPLPGGLAARVARAVHEAVARVVPATGRPALVLDWDGGSSRLDTEENELGAELSGSFDRDITVHRGREGGRLVVRDDGPAFVNGWPVATGIPQLLLHGDIVRFDDRLVAVRYDPPLRALVEADAVTKVAPPCDIASGFRFAIEPSGEPLEIRCDPATTRALTALVLRHDPDRPFDPTALTEVERATLDWIFHRAADRIASDVFGSRLALRPAAAATRPEVWVSSLIRTGGIHGAVWIGTSRAGRAMVADALAPVTRAQLEASRAVRGIRVTLSARIDIGRVPASQLATLAAGDLVAAPDVGWPGSQRWTGAGRLVMAGSDGLETRVQLDLEVGAELRAELLGQVLETGGETMLTELSRTTDGDERPFGEALDAIGVVVTIEVGRRRIRLSEALAMCAGDVIDLGAPITSNVSLLADGAPFARGELVDVEGTLGVRITAMGGHR